MNFKKSVRLRIENLRKAKEIANEVIKSDAELSTMKQVHSRLSSSPVHYHVIQLADGTRKVSEIAQEINVHETVVYYHLRKNQAMYKKPSYPISQKLTIV